MFEKVGEREAIRLKEEIAKLLSEIENEKVLQKIYRYIKIVRSKCRN